jgi:hypothetical protein
MRTLNVLTAVAAGAVVLAAGPSATHAQSPQGHGIAGFWSMAPGPTPPRRAAKLREAAKSYDPENQTDVSLTCRPPGLIYSMQGPFPIEIFEGRDLIVIKLEYFELTRVIFMNETAHPDDWPHSQTGHSIGRWEGDTLVVDTAKLVGGTLFNNGVDYTDQVRLLERFRLADANTLIITQQFEDPGSFEGTAARVMSFRRGNDHVYPYDCDPTYGLAIDSRQGPSRE